MTDINPAVIGGALLAVLLVCVYAAIRKYLVSTSKLQAGSSSLTYAVFWRGFSILALVLVFLFSAWEISSFGKLNTRARIIVPAATALGMGVALVLATEMVLASYCLDSRGITRRSAVGATTISWEAVEAIEVDFRRLEIVIVHNFGKRLRLSMLLSGLAILAEHLLRYLRPEVVKSFRPEARAYLDKLIRRMPTGH